MIKRAVLFFLFQVVIFTSCSKKELLFDLFAIDDKHVSINFLLKNGFLKSEVDVLMFETSFGDTTIMYEYDHDGEILLSKRWEFNLSEDYLNDVKNFFEKSDIHLMVPNSYSEIVFGDFFCVIKSDSNRIYFCKLEKNGEVVRMHIVYYFPK